MLLICGILDATQTFAHLVKGNHILTGEPLFTIFNHEIYNPVYFFFGIIRLVSNPKIRPLYLQAITKFAVWCIASLVVAVAWTYIHEFLAKYVWNIHGTARFAKKKDLKLNGLLKKSGVILGELNNAIVLANKKKDSSISMKLIKPSQLVCHSGKVNTLLLAPTGSGKGVSVIIPTLLAYPYSMIIFDPKGENYNLTSGYRRQFSRVIKFAPCSWNTLRFNPIMAIRDGDEYAFRDANLIADIIFAPSKVGGGQNDTEQYFSNAAKDLVTTTILHIRFCDDVPENEKNLAGVLHYLTKTDYRTLKNQKTGQENNDQGKEQCLSMIEARHCFSVTEKMYFAKQDWYDKRNIKIGDRIEAAGIHDIIVAGATRSLNRNVKEKSSVFSTVFSKLQLFEDPLLANATSGTDFEIEDFITSDVPISLYLTVPYSDVMRIAPVFRPLISFMLKKFSEGETQFGEVKLKNNVLFLLDEFPILGCFPDIAEVMGVLRGYGVFFLIVCQTLSQLIDRYGEHHPFLDHCPVHIVFAPGSIQDAKIYSEAIGQESVHQEKVSRSGQRMSSIGSLQFSDNDLGRNLLDAADIKRIPGDKALIMVHGMQPYIAEKVVYYMDKRFSSKLNFKAPQSMSELYKEVAGLPSRKRIKAEIEKRKAQIQSVQYLDVSSSPELAFEKDANGNLIYKEPEGIFDEPLERDIVYKIGTEGDDNILKAELPEDNDEIENQKMFENARKALGLEDKKQDEPASDEKIHDTFDTPDLNDDTDETDFENF